MSMSVEVVIDARFVSLSCYDCGTVVELYCEAQEARCRRFGMFIL